MGDFHRELNDGLMQFIREQKIFFVATAPREGRVNVSPKGMDTFRILDRRTVMYLDLTGSSNETAAHLRENGRMTIMFCSFDKKPLILRLYGHGRVIRREDEEWPQWAAHFDDLPGMRQIMLLQIESVQTSCGFGVPLYEFKGERDTLRRWAEKLGEDGIRKYQRENNQVSIDGLPTGLFSEG